MFFIGGTSPSVYLMVFWMLKVPSLRASLCCQSLRFFGRTAA
jgi:hypothetical protein